MHALEKQVTDVLLRWCLKKNGKRTGNYVTRRAKNIEEVRENTTGKMKCFITSCTRKTSNVVFQTLTFEKIRENEMVNNVIYSENKQRSVSTDKHVFESLRFV